MASDLRGYSADEVLNKVLNTSNDSIQVDIVAGAEYAEDSGHTSTDTGNFILGVRNDTLAYLGGADGDYVPFQMNALGALYVTNSSVIVDDAGFTPGTSSIQMVGAEFDDSGPDSVDEGDGGAIRMSANRNLYTTIRDAAGNERGVNVDSSNQLLVVEASASAIATSLGNLDNSVDGNFLNVNINVAGTDIAADAGVMSAQTPRVTIATDDTHFGAVGAASDVDGVVHGQLRYIGLSVDTVEASVNSIQTAVEKIDNSIFADNDGFTLTTSSVNVAGGVFQNGTPGTLGDNDAGAILLNSTAGQMVELMAGTETVGKVEVVGDVAENENAAGNPVLIGGRYDASGTNDGGLRTLDTTDVGALALDPKGVLLTKDFTGQAGSILVTGTGAVTAGYGKFIAIQFLEDTIFASGASGLSATDVNRWPDDTGIGSDISSNGAAIDGVTFPQGMTIFGRWDGFTLTSTGSVIAYIGYV